MGSAKIKEEKEMSKLLCICGWEISNVASPCDHVGEIINGHQSDEHFDDKLEEFYSELKWIWECPKCGCIAIDKSSSGREVVWFKPFEQKYHGLLLPEQPS